MFKRNSRKAFLFGAIAGGIQTLVTMMLATRGLVVAGAIIGYILYAIAYSVYFNITEEQDNGID